MSPRLTTDDKCRILCARDRRRDDRGSAGVLNTNRFRSERGAAIIETAIALPSSFVCVDFRTGGVRPGGHDQRRA